jgi:hypothetical protein
MFAATRSPQDVEGRKLWLMHHDSKAAKKEYSRGRPDSP